MKYLLTLIISIFFCGCTEQTPNNTQNNLLLQNSKQNSNSENTQETPANRERREEEYFQAKLDNAKTLKLKPRKLQNADKNEIMNLIEAAIKKHDLNYRLLAEVSYVAFITVKNNNDIPTFLDLKKNSELRCDFLILNDAMMPLLVIEYYGSGHFGNNPIRAKETQFNDSTKEALLESAGIDFLILKEEEKNFERIEHIVININSNIYC